MFWSRIHVWKDKSHLQSIQHNLHASQTNGFAASRLRVIVAAIVRAQNDGRLFGFFLCQQRHLIRQLAGGPQVQVQCLFGAIGDETDERPYVTFVCHLEVVVILQSVELEARYQSRLVQSSRDLPLLLLNDDWRKSVLHKNRIHQQTRRSSVPIDKGMQKDELVVSYRCQSQWMHLMSLLRVEPFDKSVHHEVHFAGLWRNVIANVDLRLAKGAALDWVHVTQHALVNLQNVFDADVSVPKMKVALDLILLEEEQRSLPHEGCIHKLHCSIQPKNLIMLIHASSTDGHARLKD